MWIVPVTPFRSEVKDCATLIANAGAFMQVSLSNWPVDPVEIALASIENIVVADARFTPAPPRPWLVPAAAAKPPRSGAAEGCRAGWLGFGLAFHSL